MMLLRERKNNERLHIFSYNVVNLAGKTNKSFDTLRKKTELASLTVRGKIMQTRFLVSEIKFFSLKQLFALATQVFIDQF